MEAGRRITKSKGRERERKSESSIIAKGDQGRAHVHMKGRSQLCRNLGEEHLRRREQQMQRLCDGLNCVPKIPTLKP